MTGLDILRTKIGPLIGEMEICEDGLPHYFVTGKWAEYYKVIERELKALEIIKKYPRNPNSLQNFRAMSEYWKKEGIEITKERLENYDFPFEVDEFKALQEVLL